MAQDGAAGLAHDMEVRRNGKAKDEDIGYDTGKPVETYISVQYASGTGTASGGYVQFKRCGGSVSEDLRAGYARHGCLQLQ